MKKGWYLLIAGLMASGMTGCQKEDMQEEDIVQLTEQEILVDGIAADLDALVSEAFESRLPGLKAASSREYSFLGTCPQVTLNPDANPKTLTLDFGTECTGPDGKVRSGKLLVTAPSFTSSSMTWAVSMDHFMVDGKQLGGDISKTVTFDFKILKIVTQTVEDLTITFTETGETLFRKADVIREYGLDLGGLLNNKTLSFSGSVDFTNGEGVTVSKTVGVSKPLVYSLVCHQFVKGSVSYVSSGGNNWSVDFGDGECDNVATLIKGNQTKTLNLW